MQKFIFIAIVCCLFLTTGAAFAGSELEVGSKAPDFSLTVAGTDTTITLSDFVDQKIVIVHFWKTK